MTPVRITVVILGVLLGVVTGIVEWLRPEGLPDVVLGVVFGAYATGIVNLSTDGGAPPWVAPLMKAIDKLNSK